MPSGLLTCTPPAPNASAAATAAAAYAAARVAAAAAAGGGAAPGTTCAAQCVGRAQRLGSDLRVLPDRRLTVFFHRLAFGRWFGRWFGR